MSDTMSDDDLRTLRAAFDATFMTNAEWNKAFDHACAQTNVDLEHRIRSTLQFVNATPDQHQAAWNMYEARVAEASEPRTPTPREGFIATLHTIPHYFLPKKK